MRVHEFFGSTHSKHRNLSNPAGSQVPMRLPDEGEVVLKVQFAGINGGCETFRARGEAAFARNRWAQDSTVQMFAPWVNP